MGISKRRVDVTTPLRNLEPKKLLEKLFPNLLTIRKAPELNCGKNWLRMARIKQTARKSSGGATRTEIDQKHETARKSIGGGVQLARKSTATRTREELGVNRTNSKSSTLKKILPKPKKRRKNSPWRNNSTPRNTTLPKVNRTVDPETVVPTPSERNCSRIQDRFEISSGSPRSTSRGIGGLFDQPLRGHQLGRHPRQTRNNHA